MSLYLLPLFLVLTSCSLQKLALRSSTSILEKSSEGMMKEGNWDFFRQAAPSNIKFLEVLWMQDKDNLRLLSALIKSYAGYAFTVSETLLISDELRGLEDSPWKHQAISFYTRALDYGVFYLGKKGLTPDDLLTLSEADLKTKLKRLDEEDITALLYLAQAWGSLINLQKDNVVLVAQVPKVKLLFDHVCEKKPNIDNNVCDIFYAQYLSSRPKMLGGHPEKGEELFLQAIENHPRNLLIRVTYLQQVVLPAYDQDKYEKQAKILQKEFANWEDLKRESLKNESLYYNFENLNLFNAIAKKRFLLMEKNKKHIF